LLPAFFYSRTPLEIVLKGFSLRVSIFLAIGMGHFEALFQLSRFSFYPLFYREPITIGVDFSSPCQRRALGHDS